MLTVTGISPGQVCITGGTQLTISINNNTNSSPNLSVTFTSLNNSIMASGLPNPYNNNLITVISPNFADNGMNSGYYMVTVVDTGNYVTYAGSASLLVVPNIDGASINNVCPGDIFDVLGIGFSGVGANNIIFTDPNGNIITTPGHVTSDTTISVTTPNLSPGIGYLIKGSYLNSNISFCGQTAIFSSPKINSVQPTSGPVIGGTEITISGVGFSSLGINTQVTIYFNLNNIQTTISGTIINDTTILANTPNVSSIGGGEYIVTVSYNSETLMCGSLIFSYYGNMTSISPPQGPVTGGNLATIYGTGLPTNGFIAISNNIIPYNGTSTTEITFTVPAQSLNYITGTYYVSVTNVSGKLAYTYLPQITQFVPNSASYQINTQVTISGYGFNNVNQIHFALTNSSFDYLPANPQVNPPPASTFYIQNNETIIFTTGFNTGPSTYNVTVVTSFGSSNIVSFTFN